MADWNQQILQEFRENGGDVTTGGFGRSLILLHHVGARTGTARVSPVAAIPDGDGAWLVAASKGGAPTNPAWYHNLLAHPETQIETPDEGTLDVHVEELRGADRDAGWEKFLARSEGFRSYQARTARTIPVLRLTRC